MRPNIILLVADDLGWSDVGYLGSQIRTPNIDALAESGARLNQFYVMPSCTPTRASLLTGRHPIRYGLQVGVIKPQDRFGLPADEKLLSQELKEAGYQTAIVGKWHLGLSSAEYLPTNRGFDHQYGCYNGMIDYVTHTVNDDLSWDAQLVDPESMAEPTEDLVGHDWNADESAHYEKGYATDLIRDEAVRVIRERDVSKPLFLYVPFTAPHTPLQAKDLDLGQYEGVDMATPKIFDGESSDKHELRQKRRRFYAALVSSMDAAIGRIRETLREEGMEENTFVLFMSDNGASYQGGCNDPLRGQKMLLYEGGVRVPAAVSFPGRIKPGTIVEQHMHAVDIYPTLATLAGSSISEGKPLDGVDAWPYIASGHMDPEREILLNARDRRSSAIRIGRWKLVRNGHLGPTSALGDDEEERFELFDLDTDPCETENVAGRHPDVFARLKGRLDAYAREAVPALFGKRATEKKPVPKVWKPYWWREA